MQRHCTVPNGMRKISRHRPRSVNGTEFCHFALLGTLRTFARKFSNIDFSLRLLPFKVDELVMLEM